VPQGITSARSRPTTTRLLNIGQRAQPTTSKLPSVSRFQEIEDDDEDKLAHLMEQLETEKLSEAKRYALKKQIQVLKAKISKAAKLKE